MNQRTRKRAEAAGLRKELGGWGAMHHGFPVGHPIVTGCDDRWVFWTPTENTAVCSSESEALEIALLWRDAVVLS